MGQSQCVLHEETRSLLASLWSPLHMPFPPPLVSSLGRRLPELWRVFKMIQFLRSFHRWPQSALLLFSYCSWDVVPKQIGIGFGVSLKNNAQYLLMASI